MLLASPAFAAMRSSTLGGANAAVHGIQTKLGETGLSKTGVGAVMGGSALGIPAHALSGLYGSTHAQALQTALQMLLARLGHIGKERNIGQESFAGSLAAFGPFLQSYLAGKSPAFAPTK